MVYFWLGSQVIFSSNENPVDMEKMKLPNPTLEISSAGKCSIDRVLKFEDADGNESLHFGLSMMGPARQVA